MKKILFIMAIMLVITMAAANAEILDRLEANVDSQGYDFETGTKTTPYDPSNDFYFNGTHFVEPDGNPYFYHMTGPSTYTGLESLPTNCYIEDYIVNIPIDAIDSISMTEYLEGTFCYYDEDTTNMYAAGLLFYDEFFPSIDFEYEQAIDTCADADPLTICECNADLTAFAIEDDTCYVPGTTLEINAGTYNLAGTIILASNALVTTNGGTVTINFQPGYNLIMDGDDITIDATTLNIAVANAPIIVQNSNNINLNDVTLYGGSNGAISLENVNGFYMNNGGEGGTDEIDNSGGTAIIFQGTNTDIHFGNEAQSFFVRGNVFYESGTNTQAYFTTLPNLMSMSWVGDSEIINATIFNWDIGTKVQGTFTSSSPGSVDLSTQLTEVIDSTTYGAGMPFDPALGITITQLFGDATHVVYKDGELCTECTIIDPAFTYIYQLPTTGDVSGTYTVQEFVGNPTCDLGLTETPCDYSGAYTWTDYAYMSVEFSNVNGTVETGDLTSGTDWVNVQTGSALDVPATIVFNDLNDATLVPYRNGEECAPEYCSNIINNGIDLFFDVTGFSNYSYGAPADPCLDADGGTTCYCQPDLLSFEFGECQVNGTLTLNSGNLTQNGTIILGAGEVLEGNGANIELTLSGINFAEVTGSNAILRDYTLDASGVSAGNIGGMINLAYGVANTLIEDITIYGGTSAYQPAITYLKSNPGTTIQRVHVETPGFMIFTNNGGDSITIRDSYFELTSISPTYTLQFDDMTNFLFENNTVIRGSINNYIISNYGVTGTINDNEIYGGSNGIVLSGTNNLLFSNNYLERGVRGGSGTSYFDYINNTLGLEIEMQGGNYYLEGNSYLPGTSLYFTSSQDQSFEATYEEVKDVTFNVNAGATGSILLHLPQGSVFYDENFAISQIATLSDIMKTGTNWLWVNSTSVFDNPATITFDNVGSTIYRPIKDGERCLTCTNIVNNGITLTFDVIGFSNYTYGDPASYNHAPTIDSYDPYVDVPMTISGDKYLHQFFSVSASDYEDDPLTYTWTVNGMTQPETTQLFEAEFEIEGNYNITVTVSDGYDSVEKTWDVYFNLLGYYPDYDTNDIGPIIIDAGAKGAVGAGKFAVIIGILLVFGIMIGMISLAVYSVKASKKK